MTEPDIIAAGKALVKAGLSAGTSGNISVREGDRVVITGTGARLGALDAGSLTEVSLDGVWLKGSPASKETALHLGFYARDEANRAVVHVHSPHAVALACLEPWSDHSAVPPLTPYFVMRVGQTPLLPYRHPGDPAMAQDLHNVPWPMHAALLASHGAIVTGQNLAEAIDRATELEEACRVALLTAGQPRRVLDPKLVSELAEKWDSPWTTTLPSDLRLAEGDA